MSQTLSQDRTLLKKLTLLHYLGMRNAYLFDRNQKLEDLSDRVLPLIMREFLHLPKMLQSETHVFGKKREILVPGSWPADARRTEFRNAYFSVPYEEDKVILYCELVSFRRNSLTLRVGNAYVEPRQFTVWAGKSLGGIEAMFRNQTEQPESDDLQRLMEEVKQVLEWMCSCIDLYLKETTS